MGTSEHWEMHVDKGISQAGINAQTYKGSRQIIWLKYYFADFVRKEVTPLPPFTDFSPKICLQKGLKLCFLLKKHLILVPKNRLRIWGVLPVYG